MPRARPTRRALRLIARRTWRYFETFVTPGDNMLPPDNFQEEPAPVLAHRTSPTNLGLYLLSTASAHDFGWAGAIDTIERLEATLATMAQARAVSRPFLQLVRYAEVSAPSIRNMSRRSTAAISRDISSRSPTPARIGARRLEDARAARRDHRCSQPRSRRGRRAAGPPPHRDRHLASARRVRRAALR